MLSKWSQLNVEQTLVVYYQNDKIDFKNKLYLVHVHNGLHKMLVAHFLVSDIQCTRMNARIMYTSSPVAVTNVIVEDVKYDFNSLLEIPRYCKYCDH
jgi:hypothetical protein